MTGRRLGAWRRVILVTLITSCSGSTGPASGNLNVQLSSAGGEEGAVLFTVTGGPVDAVEATGGSVYTAEVDPNTIRVVVTGKLGSGPIARIRIADVSQASHYSATVNQVAVRSTYALRDPGQYVITLAH
jgi:hypothetical protein